MVERYWLTSTRIPDLKTIPTVITTCSEAESDITKCHGRHANSYLAKLLHFETFQKLVKNINDSLVDPFQVSVTARKRLP
jgi:hypothetical protein